RVWLAKAAQAQTLRDRNLAFKRCRHSWTTSWHHLWPTVTSGGGRRESAITMRLRPTSRSSPAVAVVRPRKARAYVTRFGNRGAPTAKQRHRRDGRVDILAADA